MGIFDFLKNKKKGNEGGVSSKIDISSTNDADIQENHKSNKSGLPNFEEVSENKYDNEGVFETKVKEIFAQFEKDLNSENFKDFPVPYWYDIVKGRADYNQNYVRSSFMNFIAFSLSFIFINLKG